MYQDLFSNRLIAALNKVNYNLLNEIRLRALKPIIINVSGKNFYLSDDGATLNKCNAIICDKSVIDNVVRVVSSNSLYSINDQLINGYVTYKHGIRIGVAGEVVCEGNIVKTIKNISSLNIRIPHLINNCSLPAYNFLILNGGICSTLIISPPGAGKTTFLKDLIKQISSRNLDINILVVDERSELTAGGEFELGDSTDVVLNCTKKFGFGFGIRSLKPNVIICDEINFDSDLQVIEEALTCGIKVIATVHAENIHDLKNKKYFASVTSKQCFQRFVVLNDVNGPGEIVGIYDECLRCVYC